MEEKNTGFDTAVDILCDELAETVRKIPERKKSLIQEIRLRVHKPVTFSYGSETLFADSSGKILYSYSDKVYTVSKRNIYDTFRRICSYSVYSHQNDIKNGFITVHGGHRVGICGTAVVNDGKISAVSDISSLNIRIARQIFGVSEELVSKLCPLKNGVLIVGAPSSGKTTLLRDIAYRISMGMGCKMQKTVVIDERGELSGTHNGVSFNDMGLCDILNGYPKGEGILQAIRSLSPQVIICDELGTDKDCENVAAGLNAGAKIIASIHASGFDELMRRSQAVKLLKTGAFGTAVFLESADKPCKITGYEMINEV